MHTKTSLLDQAGLMLVASGDCIFPSVASAFTQRHAHNGIAAVPLSDPDATIPVTLSFRTDETSPAVLQFIEAARASFARHKAERRTA